MRARAMMMVVGVLLVSACDRKDPRDLTMRLYSASYSFVIGPSEVPPYAREATLYKVVVLDKESRQPIETGEGQIYANDSTQKSTWDGFRKGTELGTYYGKLNFLTAGTWAVAIRFRRDSLSPLETVEWTQEVRNERDVVVP
jgi:hypothetical protein